MLLRLGTVLDWILVKVDIISLGFARAGGFLILATVVMVTVEILSRSLTGRSVVHATEITGYVMAISASWSFAYALMRKAHIRIDVFYLTLPETLRGILDLLALSAMALFCVLVVGAAFDVAAYSWTANSTANTPLGTPLWIPQALWALGLIWFSTALGVVWLRVLVALLARDILRVQQVAGSPTLDEQITDETKGAA